MKKLIAWTAAIRPHTLLIAIAPVMIGSAMAYGDGSFHFPSALSALALAVALQGAINLYRSAGSRISGSSLLTSRALRHGSILLFLLAASAASGLIVRVGYPALLVLGLSVLVGIFYNTGRWSLARTGLGDLAACILFGPVAVTGTYYVQSFEYNAAVVLAGTMTGFMGTAVLAVNNLRDMTTDAASGQRTLAVQLGKTFPQIEYLFCVLAAAAGPVAIYYLTDQHPATLLTSLTAFAAIPLIHGVFTREDTPSLNWVLGLTILLLFVQAVGYSCTWLL